MLPPAGSLEAENILQTTPLCAVDATLGLRSMKIPSEKKGFHLVSSEDHLIEGQKNPTKTFNHSLDAGAKKDMVTRAKENPLDFLPGHPSISFMSRKTKLAESESRFADNPVNPPRKLQDCW